MKILKLYKYLTDHVAKKVVARLADRHRFGISDELSSEAGPGREMTVAKQYKYMSLSAHEKGNAAFPCREPCCMLMCRQGRSELAPVLFTTPSLLANM